MEVSKVRTVVEKHCREVEDHEGHYVKGVIEGEECFAKFLEEICTIGGGFCTRSSKVNKKGDGKELHYSIKCDSIILLDYQSTRFNISIWIYSYKELQLLCILLFLDI